MNRKRVQTLRNVIAGIPGKRIFLDSIYRNSSSWSPPKPCGAVACIAGWAWIYPPFVKAGIRKRGWEPIHSCRIFFDVGSVFDGQRPNERGSHKAIALRRLDKLLAGS